MRHISFAWTTPALLAGEKTVTRRRWQALYARRLRAGEQLAAYDKSPRVHGRQVAVIELTHKPTYEPLRDMPDADYRGEGWEWLYAHPEHLPTHLLGLPATRESYSRLSFEQWRRSGESMWVVRFRLVTTLDTNAPAGEWPR